LPAKDGTDYTPFLPVHSPDNVGNLQGSIISSGNTPSDLEVPEGEHAIAIKTSGYKARERKMKIVAGSSIYLNAEMEKTVNP